MLDQIYDMFSFAVPLRIIERPDSLVVRDYRPTWLMACGIGIVLFFASTFILIVVKAPGALESFGVWTLALIAVGGLILALSQSIREVYYFDLPSDSYRLVRQYVYRQEVIEGALDQFTGAHVKTETNDGNQSHYVVLRQEGMFLTGINEQTLRENLPIFNSFWNESQIANSISTILSKGRTRREKKRSG
jgi:hypothetical protein